MKSNKVFIGALSLALIGCTVKQKTTARTDELRFEWTEQTTSKTPTKQIDKTLIETPEPAPIKISARQFENFDDKAKAITDFTLQWEGTPHRIGGMSREGIDCSGFTVLMYKELFDHKFTSRRSADLFTEVDPVPRKDLKPGDLVFFKIYGRRIDHVGVYIGDSVFAHASVRKGVIFSRLTEPYYDQRFYMGGRVKQPSKNESSSIQ
ncbi:MAG: C40 family peptidase [Thermaurantimonas sp.]|uniref:C40 family peptidase n=1 Tax=Thermaurantimonas sp. TaxID=2681568 RepID=UPI00391D3827